MKTVLIGGGTGLVGGLLSEMLTAKGFQVLHLSRKANPNARFPAYSWNPAAGEIDESVMEKADAVINLAGAGIANGLWTASRKKLIIDSRVQSTLLLKKAIENASRKPAVFVSAAAVGYYGDRGEELLTETSTPGKKGFLSESCIEWENAIRQLDQTGVRNVWLRIGIVLSTRGGALAKMMLPVRFFIGGYFGNGRQWYSWIHIEDLCRMFIFALENDNLSGVYNAVAPMPERNKAFVKTIADAMEKPALMIPGPEFVLRMGLGEMADTVLSSSKVSAEKILKTGFQFQFPELFPALKDLIHRKI